MNNFEPFPLHFIKSLADFKTLSSPIIHIVSALFSTGNFVQSKGAGQEKPNWLSIGSQQERTD
uniref:Uncharacterized protein n=1 Tax=Romanomermis culicivorax TaxID=13658 RepID=A0A915K4U1_ROMCU